MSDRPTDEEMRELHKLAMNTGFYNLTPFQSTAIEHILETDRQAQAEVTRLREQLAELEAEVTRRTDQRDRAKCDYMHESAASAQLIGALNAARRAGDCAVGDTIALAKQIARLQTLLQIASDALKLTANSDDGLVARIDYELAKSTEVREDT